MKHLLLSILVTLVSFTSINSQDVTVGADRTDLYIPLLKGKRVALYSNHTGLTRDGRHTLDMLIDNDIDVRYLFSPEHGFRGTADAGEKVNTSRDNKTGLPIISLYGNGKKQALNYVDSVDVIITDIQDVGTRFYTYYCTMLDLMNRALVGNKEFMILDRPNPLSAMGVDGPVLDMKHASGVGRLPIPILHGMTLGELAQMASGEGWLKDGKKSRLTVIPCAGYTHSTLYQIPISPSPNLKTMHAIYLYPSTCFFEGTVVSLGRGTDTPFEIYGHPAMKGPLSFTPTSLPGAKNPPLLGKLCHGEDLRTVPTSQLIERGVDLTYVIDAYNKMGRPDNFFTNFFVLLAGTQRIRDMITSGMDADSIKATWQHEAKEFNKQRQSYLLYP